MNRVELKFIIDQCQYNILRESLLVMLEPDQHTRTFGRYPILSAYFDTPELEYFYQKIEGEFEHCKVRFRTYGTHFTNPGAAFIEAKLKYNNNQDKIRIPCMSDQKYLDPISWYFIQDSRVNYLRTLVPFERLIHVCSVYYEREAFQGWVESVDMRINFDHNLVFLSSEEIDAGSAVPRKCSQYSDAIILEVKSAQEHVPETLQFLLRRIGVSQTRVSKYAEAITYFDQSYDFHEVRL